MAVYRTSTWLICVLMVASCPVTTHADVMLRVKKGDIVTLEQLFEDSRACERARSVIRQFQIDLEIDDLFTVACIDVSLTRKKAWNSVTG